MEIKINKDVKEYSESLFFGLSFRQCFFSVCAIGIAVLIYFATKNYLPLEVLTWCCILGAFPFAILGFVKYHGMSAEQLICVMIINALQSKKLLYVSKNYYYESINKKGKKKHDKNAKNK